MTNFAITGGEGLIGSKLKEKLEKKGHKCNLEIDLRKGSNILNINDYGHNIETQPIDIFYHLGAFCKIHDCIENPRLSNYNNAQGTFQALEFCRLNNIKKFVYFSSSRVLSKERNPYVASKIYGEELCKAYYECYGIDYLIVRPSTVYGEHHDLTTRLITKWVINVLKGEPIKIYGDRKKTLDFTHVEDFVDGIELLIKQWENTKNQSYDICGNDHRKLIDVARLLEKLSKRKVKIIWRPAQIAQPQDVKIDISKLEHLGYVPKIKLEMGLKRLIKFYKTEGKKWIS